MKANNHQIVEELRALLKEHKLIGVDYDTIPVKKIDLEQLTIASKFLLKKMKSNEDLQQEFEEFRRCQQNP